MAERKPVVYRGGVVRFRIPASWVEEYEEAGGGTFYADRPDSGTLRLNILTFEGSSMPTSSDLLGGLAGKRSEPTLLANGNALVWYSTAGNEAGEDLAIFRWELANAVPPKHLRLALFAYTVSLSETTGIRYQTLINLYLGDCATQRRELAMEWRASA